MSQSTSRETFSLAAAQWAYRSFQGDPLAETEQALAVNPSLVAAHLLRACVLFTTSERVYLAEAIQSIDAAQALYASASDAERTMMQALRELCGGDWIKAAQLFDEVLGIEPHNIVALQTAHILDFMRGDAVSLRDRIARVLPCWSDNDPGYSFVLGMYAFGLEECNEFARAEEMGRRAVEIEPRDAWATHAVAHVMEMQGRSREGAQWLADTAVHWQQDNGMACHNWWHKALFHLELNEAEEALTIVDTKIIPNLQDMSIELVDVSSMLMRMQILGMDVGTRAEDIARRWQGKLENEPGYYAFNDFHAALAFASAGQLHELQQLQQAIVSRQPDVGKTSQWMNELVGLPIVDAVVNYARGDLHDAADLFGQVRARASGFGGSNAQRDVITWLYMDCFARTGNNDKALRVVNERLMAKPEEELARNWQDRLAG